jgi:hypothetical protein
MPSAKETEVAENVVRIGYGHEHPSRPPDVLTLRDLSFFLDRYDGTPASLYAHEAALYAKKAIHLGMPDLLRDRAVRLLAT